MDDSCIPRKAMGGCFSSTRPVGEPRERWVDAVWRVALDLLKIQNCKVAARKTGRGGYVFSQMQYKEIQFMAMQLNMCAYH
jgi:hypothetical protein